MEGVNDLFFFVHTAIKSAFYGRLNRINFLLLFFSEIGQTGNSRARAFDGSVKIPQTP